MSLHGINPNEKSSPSHTLSFSGFVAGNDDLTLNCDEEGIEERYKGSSEIKSDASFQECVMEGDFSDL